MKLMLIQGISLGEVHEFIIYYDEILGKCWRRLSGTEFDMKHELINILNSNYKNIK